MFIFLLLIGFSGCVFSEPCTNGYAYFEKTENCYKTYVPVFTHRSAQIHCQTEGGALASIHSAEENKFIIDLYNRTALEYMGIVPRNGKIWIGNQFDPFTSDYLWSDGSNADFSNFKEGTSRGNKDFVAIDISEQGKWSTGGSYHYNSYVCKKPSASKTSGPKVEKTCSKGYTWEPSTKFCYKVAFQKSTYQSALQQCSAEGANLLSIHSPDEHTTALRIYKSQLESNFGDQSYVYVSYLWTGLFFDSRSMSWTWSDGSKMDYANWDNPRFGGPLDGQNWAVINVSTAEPRYALDEKWVTVGEPNFFSFICKKPDTSVITPHSLITTSSIPVSEMSSHGTECSEGYRFYSGFCYKFSRETVNFTIANENCKRENGNLASIHSEGENQFLIGLAEKVIGTEEETDLEFYIGLIYNYDNNRWEWTDGTPVDYSKWMYAEPNFIYNEAWTSMSYRVREEKVVVHDGWNNMMGEQDRGYFCKRNAIFSQ